MTYYVNRLKDHGLLDHRDLELPPADPQLTEQTKRIQELEATIASLKKQPAAVSFHTSEIVPVNTVNGNTGPVDNEKKSASVTSGGNGGVRDLANYILETSLPAVAEAVNGAAKLPTEMGEGSLDLTFKLGLEVTRRPL